MTDEQQEQALMILRAQLFAAAQRLKGERLDELKQLVKEIAQTLDVLP